jgi:hypothetical protein
MKIDIRPNLDQIRFYARTAMHAWDYQDLEAGRAQVIADMQELLGYLDGLNNGEGIAIASISRIEAGVRIERSTREGDAFDLTDRYVAERIGRVFTDPDHHCRPGAVVTENGMGQKHALAVKDGQTDLAAVERGPTEQ